MIRILQALVSLFCLALVLGCGGGGGGSGTPPTPGGAALSITAQPVSLTVVDGQAASFSVTVTGSPPFSYQWHQGTTRLAGATGATYTIPSTIYSFHNGLQYSVDVADARGTKLTSQAALLTITPIAPRASAPLSQTVVPGSTATFSTQATGSLPLSYQWTRNGSNIAGATANFYTTGILAVGEDNGSTYAVIVENGARQSVTSATATLTVSPAPGATNITVDCTQADSVVAQQVTYRRGLLEAVDRGGESGQAMVADVTQAIQAAGSNLLNATLDLNAGPNSRFFNYTAGSPPVLEPSTTGTASLVSDLGMLRRAVSTNTLPAVVQVSGTPAAFADYLDPTYLDLCTGNGNFYPLPLTGVPMQVAQNAVAAWISHVNASFAGGIWIGTQEPTHTLGFQDSSGANCSNPTPAQRTDGEEANIQRFISYWAPIALQLKGQGIKVGGLQLNSGNSAYYSYAAQQIMASQMKLDYFTIQNFAPSAGIIQSLHDAYVLFQQNPDYRQVKVLFDRYGTTKTSGGYSTAVNMIDFLQAESQIMPFADMMYGYTFMGAGIHSSGTLLPQVLQWLQKAPAPLRPLTSSTSDLQAFALVKAGNPNRAYVAIWNTSPSQTAYTTSVSLNGLSGSFTNKVPVVLKGSGSSITAVNDSHIVLNGTTISGLQLNWNEFLLISLQ